jgi:hypothetical protein
MPELAGEAQPVATCKAAGRGLTEAEWATYFPGREYEPACTR